MKLFNLLITPLLIMVLASCLTAAAGQAKTPTADLMIHITGFENSNGLAMVALVNSKENYESDGKPYMGFMLKIVNNEVRQTISIPHGEYAMKVFHDANANGELDTLLFNIPAEGYGFSNNARGPFGPPAYEDAKFNLESPQHQISIKIQ